MRCADSVLAPPPYPTKGQTVKTRQENTSMKIKSNLKAGVAAKPGKLSGFVGVPTGTGTGIRGKANG